MGVLHRVYPHRLGSSLKLTSTRETSVSCIWKSEKYGPFTLKPSWIARNFYLKQFQDQWSISGSPWHCHCALEWPQERLVLTMGHWERGVRKYRYTGTPQEHRNTGVQEYRSTGVQIKNSPVLFPGASEGIHIQQWIKINTKTYT